MTRRILDNAEIQQCIAEFDAGAHRKALAASHYVSYATLCRVLSQAGRVKKYQAYKRKHTPDQRKAIAADYAAGHSIAWIYTNHDCTKSTIQRIAIDNGVPLRPCGGQRGKRGSYRRKTSRC